jgi:flavodoxin I
MNKVKVIYGSDTGVTEHVIDTFLLNMLNDFEVDLVEICNITDKDWESHDFYILGIPTWYDGELQSDWEDYFDTFKEIDFSNKTVAIFGLGDQVGYGDWFVDGIGILAKEVIANGGKIIGHWPKEGYEFNESKGLLDENTFYGLPLDEDNQDDQTEDRLNKWITLIKETI